MKDFRVRALDAKYVGPFEHLYIEFKEKVIKNEAEVHIFTGENGTGKSTILYMLACYPNWQLIFPRIQSKHPTDFSVENRYAYFDEYRNKNMFPSIKCSYPNNGKELFDGIYNDEILKEYFGTVTGGNALFIKGFDFAIFAYSGNRKIESPKLDAIKEIQEQPFFNSLDFTASSNPQVILQWIANTKTGEALALKNGDESEADSYKLSLDKLQYALSQITGTDIEFELGGRPLNVFVKWNGTKMTFEVLPDGLKSIISWIGDLIMRLDRLKWKTEIDIFDRNFVLFLDEIDVHLHPAWQRKILPVVKKLFKNAQIFVSTHSPFVVGSVDGAWVYRLKKEGQYSVLDGEPMLSEDAKSYRLILEETFGIKQQFGESIERKLEEFYKLRRRILIGELSFDDTEFQSLAYGLAEQSIELESIIGFELRQLKKIKGIKENIHA